MMFIHLSPRIYQMSNIECRVAKGAIQSQIRHSTFDKRRIQLCIARLAGVLLLQ